MVFAIFDCGFVPRCALEENDGADIRLDKIKRLIQSSRYGIHDISRTELDASNGLPRFNMPLELGLFLGARQYGDDDQKKKSILILDTERFRYQKFVSDIAGQDIRAHQGDERVLIRHIRDWLNGTSRRKTIPGGTAIAQRFGQFLGDLPSMCDEAQLTPEELTFNDYCVFVSEWLKARG